MFMDKHLTYEFEIQIFPQIQSNAHRKLDLYHLTLNKVGKNPDVRLIPRQKLDQTPELIKAYNLPILGYFCDGY